MLQMAGYDPERLSREARPSLAVSLFARKALSLEAAANVAGMSLWEFLPFLGAHDIPINGTDGEEATSEVETARWVASRTGT